MKLNKEIHYDEALELFNSIHVATQVAKDLCDKYNIEYNETEGRKVRNWLNPTLHLPLRKDNDEYQPKILIYDIETSLIRAKIFWTGTQYIGHKQLMDESKIITISYKWLGEDEVTVLTWDNEKKNDKELIKAFLKVYNSADMVIGQNNDKFDNRFINARAMKYNLDVDVYVKSFDLMKQNKRLFRLPSYSMDYISKFLKISKKMKVEIEMWEDIQYGKKDISSSALKKMCEYNIQDVLTTEEMYLKLRKYMNHVTHLGVLKGESKFSCPECGGHNLKLHRTVVTANGTIQRILKCKDDGVKFKVSNRDFLRMQLNN